MSNLVPHYCIKIIIIDQTTRERRVAASASPLGVASVGHSEEISLSSPNAAIIAADLRYTNPEQNPSVSY